MRVNECLNSDDKINLVIRTKVLFKECQNDINYKTLFGTGIKITPVCKTCNLSKSIEKLKKCGTCETVLTELDKCDHPSPKELKIIAQKPYHHSQ